MPGIGDDHEIEQVTDLTRNTTMTDKTNNVFFLCTGNSARSILAECILNKEGAGRFKACSTGSQPKAEVNPHALGELEALDDPATAQSAKRAPVWIGHPMTAQWGVEDPAAVVGTEVEIQRAFAQAARFLKNRISAFINLPLASIDRLALEQHVCQIGSLDGASVKSAKA
jgi:arsenate reductase